MATQESGEHLPGLPRRGLTTQLLSACDVGLVVLGADERVDRINSKAKALLGMSAAGPIEERWSGLKEQLAPTLQEARDRRVASVQVQGATHDSMRPEMVWIVAQHLEKEDGGGYLLFVEDAGRAAAIERSLRQAASHRCLMSLSRDTAHSLKDTLNAVLMYVELMAGAVKNGALPVAQTRHATRCADVVRRELRRLDRSLEVLLDPSMIERAVPQALDVKAICESLLLLVAARASGQHVVLTSALGTGPARMWGFPDQMHQALLGLIINALDAMPDGGTLQLALTKGRTIRVQVSDSGPGIPPDRLSDEGQRHFTTRAVTSGLGLSVTRAVVEAHGGTLLDGPSPGGGRCFIIDLPTGTRR